MGLSAVARRGLYLLPSPLSSPLPPASLTFCRCQQRREGRGAVRKGSGQGRVWGTGQGESRDPGAPRPRPPDTRSPAWRCWSWSPHCTWEGCGRQGSRWGGVGWGSDMGKWCWWGGQGQAGGGAGWAEGGASHIEAQILLLFEEIIQDKFAHEVRVQRVVNHLSPAKLGWALGGQQGALGVVRGFWVPARAMAARGFGSHLPPLLAGSALRVQHGHCGEVGQ